MEYILRIIYCILTITMVWACNIKKHSYDNQCDEHESKVIELKNTGIMDTITVTLNGHIVSLKNQTNLAYSSIELKNNYNNYQLLSDANGKFRFFHISSGTYKLITTCTKHKRLEIDSLHLGSGSITELKIGLSCVR